MRYSESDARNRAYSTAISIVIVGIIVVAASLAGTLALREYNGSIQTNNTSIKTSASDTYSFSRSIETTNQSVSSTSSIVSNNSTSSTLGTLSQNLTAGQNLWGITLDPANGYLYVAGGECRGQPGCGFVAVIDGSTNKLVANITSGFSEPVGIAYDSSNDDLYVTNSGETGAGTNYISVINPKTNTVIGSISTCASSSSIVYDQSNGYLYTVGCPVTVIDGSTNEQIANITGIVDPGSFAYDSSNRYLYVLSYGCATPNSMCDNVSVIDTSTNKVIKEIGPFGENIGSPGGITFDSSNGNLYVTNDYAQTISVINGTTNTVIHTIKLEGSNEPDSVAFDPINGYVYSVEFPGNFVSETADAEIIAINGASNSIVGNVTLAPPIGFPMSMVFDASNNHLYITNNLAGTVSAISTSIF